MKAFDAPLGVSRRTFGLLACGAGMWPGATPAATVWRLASGYPAENFHTRNLTAMAGEVERATRGALRIDVYPGNSLVPLNDIRSAAQAGKIEAGETIMSSLTGAFPIAGADSVPFISGSYDDALRLWRIQRPLIEREMACQGLQVLHAVPWPPQCLYSTRPINGLTDLRGMKMRAYNAHTARIATLIGTQPVDVPATELDHAMSQGRIDCMITSAVTGVENKVWRTMRHFYEINAWFPKNIVFANAKSFEALDAGVRSSLLASCAKSQAQGWSDSAAAAAASIDELRKNGLKIEAPSYLFGRDLKRLGERFSLEWIRQVGAPANEVFIPYFARP